MRKFKQVVSSTKSKMVAGLAVLALHAGSAHAYVDQTALDAKFTEAGGDITYLGGAFILLTIAIAVWRYLKRGAN